MPCSTSNLGAGFDCIGLALGRYLEATFTPGDDGSLTIERGGTLAGLDIAPGDDALVAALADELARRGAIPSGLLRVHSEIPIGRGLGSSAAARVAGFALAVAASGEELDRAEAWVQAMAAEGHPDNAAPCALGGLVAVTPSQTGGVSAIPLPLSPDIGWAYAAPASAVSTKAARAALPAVLERRVAVDSIRRMVPLLRGLESGDPDLLAAGFDDSLHVPHRLPLIPNGERALGAAGEAGAWAATISGSGSGLIAACPLDAASRVADAMANAFRDGRAASPDDGVVAFVVEPDLEGVQILTP